MFGERRRKEKESEEIWNPVGGERYVGDELDGGSEYLNGSGVSAELNSSELLAIERLLAGYDYDETKVPEGAIEALLDTYLNK